MNRLSKFAAVAVLILAPAVVSAQSSTVGFGVSGGLSLPTGDLSNAVDAGYSLAGHLFLKPSATESLRFRGDVSFDRFAYSGDISGTFTSLGFMANALVDLTSGESVTPYLLGGLGAFNTTSSEVANSSSTNFGVQAGAGLNFTLSGFSTFVEAKYVNVFTADNATGYVPITFGFRFTR
jgi:opacity protein-like surface antigen